MCVCVCVCGREGGREEWREVGRGKEVCISSTIYIRDRDRKPTTCFLKPLIKMHGGRKAFTLPPFCSSSFLPASSQGSGSREKKKKKKKQKKKK